MTEPTIFLSFEADGKNYSVFRSDGGLIGKYEFSLNSGGAGSPDDPPTGFVIKRLN